MEIKLFKNEENQKWHIPQWPDTDYTDNFSLCGKLRIIDGSDIWEVENLRSISDKAMCQICNRRILRGNDGKLVQVTSAEYELYKTVRELQAQIKTLENKIEGLEYRENTAFGEEL